MDAILYFVRYPEPGKVKTRLAHTVGKERAVQLYRGVAEANLRTLAQVAAKGTTLTVLCDPPQSVAHVEAWLRYPGTYVPQQGKELGERLHNAFRLAFQRGGERVVAVGSDTLGLREHHLRQAFASLSTHDVVLGLARDGGYYLIGLLREAPALFHNIPWSTREVCQVTEERAREQGLSCARLELLDDLDDSRSLQEGVKYETIRE